MPTKSTPAPTKPVCKNVMKSDVVLALDSSASITEGQWKQFMSFIDKVVDDFPIAADGMHLGAVQFGSIAHKYSDLTGSKAEALANTKNMKARGKAAGAMGEKTRMDLAVEEVLRMDTHSGRAAVDVMVVITDGLPTDGTNKGRIADVAFEKVKKAGVKVTFVLIGELFKWLPIPDHWATGGTIQIDDFAGLDKIRSQLVKIVCTEVSPPTPVTPTPPGFCKCPEKMTNNMCKYRDHTAKSKQMRSKEECEDLFGKCNWDLSLPGGGACQKGDVVYLAPPLKVAPTVNPSETPTHIPSHSPSRHPTRVPFSRSPSRSPTKAPVAVASRFIGGAWLNNGNWVNTWDGYFAVQCPAGQALTGAYSIHNNHKEDRLWKLKCAPLSGGARLSGDRWTGWTNGWDGVQKGYCGHNEFMTGLKSYHKNQKEDRLYAIRCTKMLGNGMKYGGLSEYANSFDAPMKFDCPAGSAITKMYSYHNSWKEDRRFKWECSQPTLTATVPAKPARITKYTASWGGNGGGAVHSYCPDGSHISLWKIRTGSLVDRIQGRCSNGSWLRTCGGHGGGENQRSGMWGSQKMYVRTGALVDQFNGRGGNGGGGHWLDCGPGFKITGYQLRCGSLVDKVRLQCKNV
jgi:uncharacterized protein YegL